MRCQAFVLGLTAIGVLALTSIKADAHVHKKTWILQGTVGFSSSSGDLYGDETMTVVSVAPTVHYAVIDKLALGGVLNILSTDQGNFSRTSFYIGPSLRYFFGENLKHRGTVNPYLGAAVLLRTESFDDGNPITNDEDRSGSAIQLAGGFAWYLRDALAITPELSINLESLEGESGTTIMLGAGLAGFLD